MFAAYETPETTETAQREEPYIDDITIIHDDYLMWL